jgi:N-acetylmuramoyl-L-alanine amidase
MGRFFTKILIIISLILTFSTAKAAEPIKILLVPGHDNETWGAQYGNVKEAAMNLAVASRLYNILKKDKNFEVHITRDINGYTKEFADYFKNQEAEIIAYKNNAKAQVKQEVQTGDFTEREAVPHVAVDQRTSVVLYGINKWASDNKMDAVIHIHFNDEPRKTKWTIGKFGGFAIYMPDREFDNWFESGQLAGSIHNQLAKKYKTSTYVKEKGGLIPDQKLIAMGANKTLAPSVRTVLIEYGYLYEKIFRNYTTRHRAYDDMAKRTADGIKSYFSGM